MNNKTLLCALAGCMLSSATALGQRVMTIQQLFELVEQGSKQLHAEKMGIDVASKDVDVAKSKRLPDVGASLSVSYNGNVLMTDRDFSNAKGFSQPHFGNSSSLEAQQVVYSGGALSAGVRMAELQKEQTETGVTLTRHNQRMLALGQYLDLYKIGNGIQVYEQNIKLTQQLIEDIKARQAQGMALRNDVTRYELQMESLRLALRQLQDQRSVISHQLCHTLGMAEQTILPDTTLVSVAYGHEDETTWQGRATVSSPLLRQTGLATQMAQQQVRMAKSEMLPKVALFAADNFCGPFTYDIPPIDKNFNIWYVGVGVKYSLSSIFKSNKGVRRAQASLQQHMERQQVAAEEVNNQMQQAHTLYEQSFVNLRTQQKSTQLARQNYQVVSERYLNQLALITDMIDASNVKLNAELQELDARINIVYTYYRMKFIAGEI